MDRKGLLKRRFETTWFLGPNTSELALPNMTRCVQNYAGRVCTLIPFRGGIRTFPFPLTSFVRRAVLGIGGGTVRYGRPVIGR